MAWIALELNMLDGLTLLTQGCNSNRKQVGSWLLLLRVPLKGFARIERMIRTPLCKQHRVSFFCSLIADRSMRQISQWDKHIFWAQIPVKCLGLSSLIAWTFDSQPVKQIYLSICCHWVIKPVVRQNAIYISRISSSTPAKNNFLLLNTSTLYSRIVFYLLQSGSSCELKKRPRWAENYGDAQFRYVWRARHPCDTLINLRHENTGSQHIQSTYIRV